MIELVTLRSSVRLDRRRFSPVDSMYPFISVGAQSVVSCCPNAPVSRSGKPAVSRRSESPFHGGLGEFLFLVNVGMASRVPEWRRRSNKRASQ